MKEKQNLVKRTIIIGCMGGLPLFGALAFTGQAEEVIEVKEKKVIYLEKLTSSIKDFTKPEERNIFFRDSAIIYNEYVFSDKELTYQVSFLSPRQEGLMPILEIHNLKTENYFYDYGCNGFNGEMEDGFYLEEVKSALSFDTLNVLYEEEIQKVLALMPSEQKTTLK